MNHIAIHRRSFLAMAMLVTACACAFHPSISQAAEYNSGDLTITNPQAGPTVPGMDAGGVFFDAITTTGDKPDRLIGGSTPVSEVVEVHSMMMQDNIMRMRAVDGVEIAKGKTVSFQRGQPNAYHLMLLQLKSPLKEGGSFPLTMEFEHAGKVEVEVQVMQGAGGHKGMKMKHGDMKMEHK